ncbi:MAG: hypothetical protein E7432_09250 [Ruminococcaceae bacterium]|nr:hypothetical protein [Oscillospiraceae bacterium]
MRNTRNTKAVSVFLAVSVILSAAAIYYSMRTEKYERYITHLSDRAFSDIITSVNAVATSLDKMQYATEGRYMNTLAANVWRESMGAKAALSLLPLSDVELDETQKFISQSGAYAYSILQRGADGGTQDNISQLSDRADELTGKLWEVKTRLNNGEIDFTMLRDGEDVSAVSDMESGISDIETDFPEMGALIYDGPFSDHIELMEPLFLENKPDVEVDIALGNAQVFTGNGNLKYSHDMGGKLPCYVFTGDGISVHVTKQGGYVLEMTKNHVASALNLTPEEGVAKAREFLENNGYHNMAESYYQVFAGEVTANFCYTDNGIKVYPDLIKVTVSLDDGTVTGFESQGFIMSHRDRTLQRPKIALAEAMDELDDDLEVLENAMAIVPTDGKNEVFCYEFLCKTEDEQRLLVYVDAMSGEEENMLILIEDETGTLTM